ncbi:MAG: hypothetical protein ACYCWW_14935 [Deltaproteobacteria bacterium]
MKATLVLSLLLVSCGCGGGPSGPDASVDPCGATAGEPNDLPQSCPNPMPSFAKDVQPIIQSSCDQCHLPGDPTYPGFPYDNYADDYKYRTQMLDFVNSCLMPKAPAKPLTEAQRQALLGWLVCGAPDN